jgi:hypothetical protein
MSKEVRTKVNYLSIDPEHIPEGYLQVGVLVPFAMVAEMHLGDPVTLVVPEGGK